jgi:hypothetical protein
MQFYVEHSVYQGTTPGSEKKLNFYHSLKIALVLVGFDLMPFSHLPIFPRNLEPDFTHYLV